MVLTIDPAKVEVRALERAIDWRGKRVLELGCGDGRLTLRLAALGPVRVEALEPDAKLIRAARKALPGRYAGRVRYHVGSADHTKFPDGTFDIVLFSWVL